jgi:hypothetical protein
MAQRCQQREGARDKENRGNAGKNRLTGATARHLAGMDRYAAILEQRVRDDE